MATKRNMKEMHAESDRKTRGRTSISSKGRPDLDSKPNVRQTQRTEAARPISSGGGKQRGDRRDMSPTYTGNVKHSARGNTPRRDVKTRAR